MAKKLFTAIMMIAAISFISCEKDVEVASWDNGNKPDPDPQYTLTTEHVRAELAGTKILDDHKAILKKDGQVVGSKEYQATHQVSYTQVTIKRAIAEQLQNQVKAYANGFDLDGAATLTATVELTGCETVYFDENFSTYCHPRYGVEGAIAALGCCDPRPTTLKINQLNGNVLYATMTIADPNHDSVDYPVEINVVDDDVISAEFDDFKVTGKGTATLNEYETINGVRSGKMTLLNGTFDYTFNAGAEIVKTSANQPSLQGNVLNVNANSTSFSYTLDGVVFADNWTTIVPDGVEFTATDGSKVFRPFKSGWTLTSLSFTNVNNVWSNKAQLAADGVAQDDDTQKIRLNAVIDWEPADEATVTGKNETSLVVYETENGIRTGKTEIVKAGYNATLKAGELIRKKSQDVLRLANTNATLSDANAAFSYTLGNENFQDAWMWSAQSTATFTLPNNKTVTKPIKADYSVRSTGFTSSNNIYSNAASLYADNIAVASDVQEVKVVRATIDGYTAIAIHVTTAYHAASEDLVSDGTKIEEVFRKDNDHSQYIVRDVTSNGTLIKQYNLTNVNESAIISLLTTTEGFKPAYLEREFGSDKKKPQSWGYEEINGNRVFGVNSFMALTVYNTDPWIASVYATEDGVSYGNIHIY